MDILNTLRNLDPRDFEHCIADIWQEKQGWATEVMDEGPDNGLDVMGQPPNRTVKTALQCKRYTQNKVTSPEVNQYAALRQRWVDVEGVTIVTTSGFTANAHKAAERLDVKCIDGEDLVELIEHWNGEEIVKWYAAGKPEVWP